MQRKTAVATLGLMAVQTKVLIVGGGITGLTLAASLERAGVDYLLLEANNEITCTKGAGFALVPSSWPIFHQLGIAQDILDVSQECIYQGFADSNGHSISNSRLVLDLIKARFGKRMHVTERRAIIQALDKCIGDKGRLLGGKRVIKIEQKPGGVLIHCRDETSYSGQILVGADGVRSEVRKAMWRAAEETGLNIFSKDKTAFRGNYKCIAGCSRSLEGLPTSFSSFRLSKNDGGFLHLCAQDNRRFWIFTVPLKEPYKLEDVPRLTESDRAEIAREGVDVKISRDHKLLDLEDRLLDGVQFVAEEGFMEHWAYGRFVIAGDAAHKVEPLAGLGGNIAIEDAVALANAIVAIDRLSFKQRAWSADLIEQTLSRYERRRKDRARVFARFAWDITSLISTYQWGRATFLKYFMAIMEEVLTDEIIKRYVGAELLWFLAPPEYLFSVSCPMNAEQGTGKEERKSKRALNIWPLIPLALAVWSIGGDLTVAGLPQVREWASSTWLGSDGSGDPRQVVDYALIYALMLIESVRRTNYMTLTALPLLFGLLSQYFTPTLVLPFYFYIFYIYAQIANFKSSDHRLTDLSYTKTVLIAICFCYFTPLLPSIRSEFNLNFWFLFPLTIAVTQQLIRHLGFVGKHSVRADSLHNTNADIWWIVSQVLILTIISIGTWIIGLPTTVILDNFRAFFLDTSKFNLSLDQFYMNSQSLPWSVTLQALQSQTVPISALFWILSLHYDLRRARTRTALPAAVFTFIPLVVTALVTAAIVGPTATTSLLWLYREYFFLAAASPSPTKGKPTNPLHWGALTRENWPQRWRDLWWSEYRVPPSVSKNIEVRHGFGFGVCKSPVAKI